MPGAFERGLETFHGTVIAIAGRGALIRGPSGAGKSDLALRCLGLGRSAVFDGSAALVADDQVVLTRDHGRLVATAPQALRGLIEVRGVGILTVVAAANADIVLVVELVRQGTIERLPDPWPTAEIAGLLVPVLRLDPLEASAPLKLVSALCMAALPRVESKT